MIKAVYARDYDDEAGDAFHGGLAKVQIEGKSGYIDHTGRVVIPATFSYAYPFSEGLAAATQSESENDGWGYIDRTGHWAIPPRFEWASSFQEGLAPVNRKHDCGYIDKQGAFAVRLQSTAGEDCACLWGDFSEGLSRQKFWK